MINSQTGRLWRGCGKIHSSTQTGTPPPQVPAWRAGAGGVFTASSPHLGQQFLSHCVFLLSAPSQRLPGSPKLPRTFCTSFKNHVHIFHLFLDIVVCMSCYLQVFIYFLQAKPELKSRVDKLHPQENPTCRLLCASQVSFHIF